MTGDQQAPLTRIYSLSDPRSGELRYIGKTILSLQRRLSAHVIASKQPRTYVAKWVKSLVTQGFIPVIAEIESVRNGWQEAEQRWIKHFQDSGARLTNISIGGEGCSGYTHSLDAKRRIAAAGIGRKHTPETIAKMRGRTFTEEHRRNISIARKGATISVEQRIAISKKLTGLRPSIESRQKMRESAKRGWIKRKANS